jgi:hypothetical protein
MKGEKQRLPEELAVTLRQLVMNGHYSMAGTVLYVYLSGAGRWRMNLLLIMYRVISLSAFQITWLNIKNMKDSYSIIYFEKST